MSTDQQSDGHPRNGERAPLQESLAGVRVVAFEHAVAAPICTRHLADMGADVVKVESPIGDFARRYDSLVAGESTHFVWLNAGKRSVALDLRTQAGQEIARRLAVTADVVVTNLGPGVLARRVIRPEELPPSTISCEITGYQPTGSYRSRKAFDLIVQGEMGVTMSTGTADQPAKPGVSLADLAAGTYALVGILGALYRRSQTGVGARLNVSLSTAVAEWMSPLLLAARNGGPAPLRSGLNHQTISPYGAVHTGDGQLLNVAVQNEHQWRRFVEGVLRQPELLQDDRFSTNERRTANRSALDQLMAAATSSMTAEELGRRLDDADIPWGRLSSPFEALRHPDVAPADRWRTVILPSGDRSEVLAGPFPGPEPRAVPALGEHTAAILAELGYSSSSIRSFLEHQTLDDAGSAGADHSPP